MPNGAQMLSDYPGQKIRVGCGRCGMSAKYDRAISISSWARPSPLNRTTYFFTEISFAAMIASVEKSGRKSVSRIPFELVEASG